MNSPLPFHHPAYQERQDKRRNNGYRHRRLIHAAIHSLSSTKSLKWKPRVERVRQRSYDGVDFTSCFSLALMGITVETQLLNLHLNRNNMDDLIFYMLFVKNWNKCHLWWVTQCFEGWTVMILKHVNVTNANCASYDNSNYIYIHTCYSCVLKTKQMLHGTLMIVTPCKL